MKNITSKNGQHAWARTHIKNSVRFIILILLSLVLTVSSTQIASALSTEQNRAFNQGLFKVEADRPCSSDVGGASSGSLPSDASSTERLKYIYTWFRGKGLTPVQAAAAVGNIAVESGGIPTRKQGAGIQTSNDPTSTGSLGWGLIQWSPGSKILTRAKQAGVTTPIYEMDTQLNIIYWLMTNTSEVGVKNMLKGFTSPTLGSSAYGYKDGAVYYFEDTMEGAGSPAYGARYNAAKIALQEYEGTSTLAYTVTSGTQDTSTNASLLAASNLEQTGCSPSGVNSPGTGEGFVAKVTAYTWPYEWRSGPSPDKAAAKPTTLTAEYKKAIDQAKATNLYVGANGVDCGGYVTRLVRDSGLDPTYNNIKNGNIEGGPTATQSKYLQTSGKWRKIESGQPSSYYRPGDVAMQDGHTLIFVGDIASFWSVDTRTNKPVPPSELGKVPKANQRRVLLASASQDLRAPMADKDERVGSSAYTWYRYSAGIDTR